MPETFKDRSQSGTEVPAQTKSSSADIPTYDLYPAGAGSEAALEDPDLLLPAEKLRSTAARRENPQLNSVAESLGSTLGRMQRQLTVVAGRDSALHQRAEQAKDAARSAVESAQAKVGDAVDDWKERAKESIESASAQTQEMMEQLRRNAQEQLAAARVSLSHAGVEARRRLDAAQRNARRVAKEQPVQVIAGAFVAGLALGVLLRVWRKSNA